jgi:hypothetical protein
MATISLIMLGVAVAGAAVAAYAAYDAAEKQKQNLKTSAKIQEDDARMTRLAGEAAAERQRRKDEAKLASFRSRAGAAGIVPAEGSSLLAELDYATDAEMEAQHVKYGYTLNARSKDIQASFLRAQADQISPWMAAASSAAGSGSSIATSYAGAQKPQSEGPTTQTGGGLKDTSSSTLPKYGLRDVGSAD